MKTLIDSVYWMGLAYLSGWKNEEKNDLIIRIFHTRQSNWADFFNLPVQAWKNDYDLSDSQTVDLEQLKADLPNISFLAENYLSQGYEIIPINTPEYSPTLKKNLGKKYAPPVLYVKGNRQILCEKSIAIVGSRDAGEQSLEFTDYIARQASKDYKVVVSGFAKGVDRQALDSAIAYKGQSIIVLPQGIMTFSSGFNKYYKQIVEGDVLVLSVFPPQAGWSTGLAMARNVYIYGLAAEIYVAQSNDSGGTWNGVMDGLKKGRPVFVRVPQPDEKNANMLLIEKGAVPLSWDGTKLEAGIPGGQTPAKSTAKQEEPVAQADETEQIILELLSKQAFSIDELIKKSKCGWNTEKMRRFVKSIPSVSSQKLGNKSFYTLNHHLEKQPVLF